METIILNEVTMSEIIDTFLEAFSDYAVGFSRSEFEAMLKRRGFTPELSLGAVDDGRIVAFILNGFGEYNGKKTCYDCGTGTLPEYRGRGLAGALFEKSVPLLRSRGVEQYLLEVLDSNEPAIKVYSRAGFKISARYRCFNQRVTQIKCTRPDIYGLVIREASVDAIAAMRSFNDFTPSWQNSLESIARGRDGLIILGAYINNQAVGYCVTDPVSGDLTQISVSTHFRRRGIAGGLLSEAVKSFKSERLKALNVEEGCDSLIGFLTRANFTDGLSQYAMTRTLTND